MADEITLTLPRERQFHRIAQLVLGGLAVRLDLTFEHLEDLQLALGGLLDRADDEGDVTVRLRIEGDAIRTQVGPFERERLEHHLDRVGRDNLSLRRLLETVADGIEIAERDGTYWVDVTKTLELVDS